MKKVRILSFLGILGVVIAVLFLVSISVTQAQVSIQVKPEKPPKPDKPGKPPPEPEATWAVRIPTSGSGYMFYGIGDGDDGYYENNDANIKVSVKKNSPGAWRRYFNFVYSFDFTLTNENVGEGIPPANQVGFQNVGGLYDPNYPDGDKPCCKFPGDPCAEVECFDCNPSCMAAFLDGTHPHAGGTGEGEEDYQYFWFRINFFDHDIESMIPGVPYLLGGNRDDPDDPGDYLSIVARYRQECNPEPTYHDVELCRSINWARAVALGNPLNIEIVRLDEVTWRIWVSDNGFLKVIERYCTREKNKTKWYYPMEAKANFDFYIDFIKNPTTQ